LLTHLGQPVTMQARAGSAEAILVDGRTAIDTGVKVLG
jgi:hypothetical protein